MPRVVGKHPGGLLHVHPTPEHGERWHPIVFSAAPKPSDGEDRVCRHRSRSNHIEGFETEVAARVFLTEVWPCWDTGCVWTWDGAEIPVMTMYFPRDLPGDEGVTAS